MERRTRQRDAIKLAFEEARRPLSPTEVLDLGRAHVERLGIATVYRSIAALVEQGWLTTVELPGEAPRYEIAGAHHHHHFRCRTCARVFDLDGCPPKIEALLPDGFTMDAHEVTLFGRCADCVA